MRLGLPVLVAALALLSAPALAAWETPVIHIASDGTVTVTVNGTVEPGLNAFPAPAPPVPATITAVVDGEAVPVVYENGTIYVASDRTAAASITYVVNVTQADGGLSFTIGNQTVKLVVEPNIVLLQLPRGLLAAEQADGRLVLTVQGPDTIVYLVTQPRQAQTTTQTQTATATPAPTATQTETQTATQTATPAPTATQPQQTQQQAPQQTATATQTPAAPAQAPTQTQQPQQTAPAQTQAPAETAPTQPGGMGALTLAAAALIVAAGAAIAVAVLRGRSRPGAVRGPGEAQALMTRGLDDVDRLILETIEKNGGEMLQSELMRATGLPKTTLWRHVRRLAEQGYIEVIREGKANRLRLRRKP
ncbi:MAG: winged helix-turn-helix transcriptional regulator [Crenarchaeota archaeon]|nr:winged helix-turn-helix transcriptional regulator [Thermoproteota archaeon]